MKSINLYKIINEKYPYKNTLKYDYNGWQKLKYSKSNIKKVLICLDITLDVAKYAINNNFNLILHHHPFLFGPKSKVLKQKHKLEIFKLLHQNKISLLAAHTNYDCADKGMNFSFLKKLDCLNIQSYFKNQILKIGTLKNKTTMLHLMDLLKVKYKLKSVNYCGNLNQTIRQIVVCAGAGNNLMSFIKSNPSLVYITGEIKWSEWLLAHHKNLNLIVLDHFMENSFVSDIYDYLNNLKLENILFEKYNINNPINYF